MKTDQRQWTEATGWTSERTIPPLENAQLVLAFGATSIFKNPNRFNEIREFYPRTTIVGCSTAGEIHGTRVDDGTLVATAIHFEHTLLKFAQTEIEEGKNSEVAGRHLAQSIDHDGLVHALVISDGLKVNGSELVKGLRDTLPASVSVTGGLAGDGSRFGETLTYLDGVPESGKIIIIGFYGDRLKVGYGSLGGWDSFGPDRRVTRSAKNVLYELDDQSALELYKKYLGEHAEGLPSTGLLFPLSLRDTDSDTDSEHRVVRTILSINEEDQSMTFAGNVPEGSYVRLMKANFERLIDGANDAAVDSYQKIGSISPEFALLISCVGRKLVLKERIEEEVESVRDVLGEKTTLAGFYSYGEISPVLPSSKCELHNQTMTITTMSEV